MQVHALRDTVYAEVHARPSPHIKTPIRVLHLAFIADEAALDGSFGHVSRLAARFGAPPPEPGAYFYHQNLDSFQLRWERHTEFYTYTIIQPGAGTTPFAEKAHSVVPADWLEQIPDPLAVNLQLVMDRGPSVDPLSPDLGKWFDGETVYGSHIVDARAAVWTSFRLHGDGCGRVLVNNVGLSPFQAGRTLQRILEIETYRILTLLALPRAKEIAPRAAQLERELSALMDEFADIDSSEDEHGLLRRLTALAVEVEKSRSSSSYRFAASRAYHKIVFHRLADLREQKFPGMGTLGKFLERRLLPAHQTVVAVESQLESLSRRIARATDLLRTRVDVEIESQNQRVLAEMNRRARLQLRLQQTVEGLSVAAISYYSVGLINYAFEAAEAAGAPVNPTLSTGIAVPVVILLIWAVIRRLRRHVTGVVPEEGESPG